MSNGPRDLRFSAGDLARLSERDLRRPNIRKYGTDPLEVISVEALPANEVYDWHTQMLTVRLPDGSSQHATSYWFDRA